MIIRRAKINDADQCYNIFLADKEEYWSLDDFQTSVKDPDVIFLVAEEDDTIIGYILGFIVPTKRNEVGLHETRVYRDSRHKGIGVALVNEFCNYAFEMGGKVVSASIDSDHMKFYGDACGFERVTEWIEVVRKK